MRRPWKKKALLDYWDMPTGGMLIVSRKDDWRLHAIFTKEEINEFVQILIARKIITKEMFDS